MIELPLLAAALLLVLTWPERRSRRLATCDSWSESFEQAEEG